MSSTAKCFAVSARCRAWSMCRRASVSPWRDDQGLNIAFTFAAQGARRDDGQDFRAKFRSVSPGFFETFGVPMLEGRDFNDGDKDGSERVVIISQSLANLLYPGQNPLNRKLWWTDGVMKFIGISMEPRRIIAVVPDFDDENIIPSPAMTVYQPIQQEGWNGRLFVRARSDAYALVPTISRTIHEMSADQPVEKASTLGDVRAEVLTPDKLNAIVFGGFAAVALLISVVGVAGVLAFSVSSRTREFGIRMALGAQRRNILTNVLVEGLVMAVIGVGAGVVLGFGLARSRGQVRHGNPSAGCVWRLLHRPALCLGRGGDRFGGACGARCQGERGGGAAVGIIRCGQSRSSAWTKDSEARRRFCCYLLRCCRRARCGGLSRSGSVHEKRTPPLLVTMYWRPSSS